MNSGKEKLLKVKQEMTDSIFKYMERFVTTDAL